MKKVMAYVKPFKLESLLNGLPQTGVSEVCISEVRGFGRQKGHLELYREHEYDWAFLPKARVEIYCEDEAQEAVIAALTANCRTGRIGDGKILVTPIEQGIY